MIERVREKERESERKLFIYTFIWIVHILHVRSGFYFLFFFFCCLCFSISLAPSLCLSIVDYALTANTFWIIYCKYNINQFQVSVAFGSICLLCRFACRRPHRLPLLFDRPWTKLEESERHLGLITFLRNFAANVMDALKGF